MPEMTDEEKMNRTKCIIRIINLVSGYIWPDVV